MKVPLLELEEIKKSFNGKVIFENTNLEIYPRDIIGIIGHNGCGKTTLVKIISGLITSDNGNIKWCGNIVDTNNIDYKSNISILGDANRSLYWNLTGKQNIEYFTAIMNTKLNNDFYEEFINKMKMKVYIDNKVSNYSKGMKQKLMLLIALITTPKLVIMDEPLNGLDIESVYLIEEVINNIVKEHNTSFLITSHDKYFIDEICNKKYEITKERTLLKSNEECVTKREFTLFLKMNNMATNSELSKIMKVIDAVRGVYTISIGLNDHEMYHELSKGLVNNDYKIISISS